MDGSMDGWGKNNNKTKEADDSLIMHTHTRHTRRVSADCDGGATERRVTQPKGGLNLLLLLLKRSWPTRKCPDRRDNHRHNHHHLLIEDGMMMMMMMLPRLYSTGSRIKETLYRGAKKSGPIARRSNRHFFPF